MSVRVMALVWGTDLPPHLRYTLLAYADHANDDGDSVYPGEDRMVRKTGYSVPTIRRHTADLLDRGFLRQVRKGHRGQRAEFAVNLDALKGSQIDTHSEPNGYQNVPNGYQNDAEWVSETLPMGIAGDTPNHQEPSENHQRIERPRDYVWEAFVEIHGEPATKSERGKFNLAVRKLKDADVTPEEYPVLVWAFTTKHDGLQPGIMTVAERIGELRHFVNRGPVHGADLDEVSRAQAWRALEEGA